MEIVVFVLIIITCVLCHKLSTAYNELIKEKYCEGCINWWWSITIAVLLTATLLTIGENTFWIFLLLTLGAAGLSAWLCHKKMISWGATSKEAGLGGIVQVTSSIGIAAAIIFILGWICSNSNKKRRRR